MIKHEPKIRRDKYTNRANKLKVKGSKVLLLKKHAFQQKKPAMEAPVPTLPETRMDICAALQKFAVKDVNEAGPLYELQHQLATIAYAKAIASVHQNPSHSPVMRCKYASEIENAYAVMDAFPTDRDLQTIQINKLIHLMEMGACFAQTDMGRIHHVMQLSASNAYSGCIVLRGLLKQGVLNPFVCGSIGVVLKAMNVYGGQHDCAKKLVYIKGVEFLHAAIILLPASTSLIIKEQDAARIIISAKHSCAAFPDLVKKCNTLLTLL
jgi:hypothetical protein